LIYILKGVLVMKTAKIFCKNVERGIHNFYVQHEGKEYYLFSQEFKKGVHDYYRSGVVLKQAFDHSRAKFDPALNRTMRKLYSHVKYIEKEYDIRLLNRA